MNSKTHLRPPFKLVPQTTRSAAFIGLFCISTAATSLAAFETLPEATVEDPGISLGSGTSGITGTVIDAHDSLFNVSTDFAGILRSMVVDTGLGFDFYYQIVNTGSDDGNGTDIFRLKTLGGFEGATLSVTYRTDLTGLDFAGFSNGPSGGAGAYAVGTKSVFSADRDEGSTGSVGFDFSPSHFLFDAANVQTGQSSQFAVIHTNLTTYATTSADVSGLGTARVASFALVPEPQTAAMVMLGATVLSRRSRRHSRA